MNWLRILLQSISFFESARYWRGAVIAFAGCLVLVAIATGSIALAIFAFLVAGYAMTAKGEA
jgi:hypothetical protein